MKEILSVLLLYQLMTNRYYHLVASNMHCFSNNNRLLNIASLNDLNDDIIINNSYLVSIIISSSIMSNDNHKPHITIVHYIPYF